jgi:hypothetical protein
VAHGATDAVLNRFEQALDLHPLELLDECAHQSKAVALVPLKQQDQRGRRAGDARLERSQQRRLHVRVAYVTERPPDRAKRVGKFMGRVAAVLGDQRQELANPACRHAGLVYGFDVAIADRSQM